MKCFQCFCICPKKAISYENITPDDAEEIYQKFQDNPSMQVIMRRKSIRQFKKTPIDNETINKIIQTSKFCPSALNTRNVEFYVLSRETIDKIALDAAKAIHVEKAQSQYDLIFRGAPHCIVAVADKKKPIFHEDGVIFLENIDLVAESMNIGTFWDGFFRRALLQDPQLCKKIGIPEDKQVLGCMGIGYKDIEFQRVVLREKI